MPQDKLLVAYDYINDEFKKYNKRLGDVVNSRSPSQDQSTRNEEILNDFKYFSDDWLELVIAAKNSFGAANVERALIHLGMDKSGNSISSRFGSGP